MKTIHTTKETQNAQSYNLQPRLIQKKKEKIQKKKNIKKKDKGIKQKEEMTQKKPSWNSGDSFIKKVSHYKQFSNNTEKQKTKARNFYFEL